MLLDGCLYEVVEFLQEKFPKLWDKDKRIHISLMCLRFIDLIREKRIGEAIKYAQKYLSNYRNYSIRLRDQNDKDTHVSMQVLLLMSNFYICFRILLGYYAMKMYQNQMWLI